MFDTNEVNEDGTIYVEKSIPLGWACFLGVGFLLLFALAIAILVSIVQ